MSLDTALDGAADWTPGGPLTPITAQEEALFAEVDERIQQGMATFLAVGNDLLLVRDRRLYRGSFRSFEVYCQERGVSRKRAYDLMAAAEVVEQMSPMGDAPLPVNERQARALAAADPAERADVMAAVAATGKSVTAAAITDEIKARHPEPTPPAPSPAPPTVETGQVHPTAPPAPTSPGAQAEPEDDRCGACGESTPDVTDGWCNECWVAAHPAPPPKPKAEKPPSEKAWAPAKALGNGLRSMLTAREVMEVLPSDSVEEFDRLADEAIAWGKRWKEERASAKRLRLMGVK